MKKIFFSLAVSVAFSVATFADSVTPRKGATVYFANILQVSELKSGESDCRLVVSPGELSIGRINRSSPMEVKCFATSDKQKIYDLYVVMYRNRYCFLPSSEVDDNSLLETECEKVSRKLKWLSDNKYRRELNDVRKSLLARSEDSLSLYNDMLSRMRHERDSIVYIHASSRIDSITNLKNAVDTKLASVRKSCKALSSVCIAAPILSSPNSVGGHDVTLTYINISDKTIKYFDWTGYAQNAVGDRVACEIRGASTFHGRDTGPCAKGEYGGGTWENIIYKWSAREFYLSSVRITYLDGSVLNVTKSDLALMLKVMELTEMSESYENAIKAFSDQKSSSYKSIVKEYMKDYSETSVEIKIDKWKDMRDRLKGTLSPILFSENVKKDPFLKEYFVVLKKAKEWDELFESYKSSMNF